MNIRMPKFFQTNISVDSQNVSEVVVVYFGSACRAQIPKFYLPVRIILVNEDKHAKTVGSNLTVKMLVTLEAVRMHLEHSFV